MRTTHGIKVEGEEIIVLDWCVPDTGVGRETAVFVHGFGSNRRGDKADYFAGQFAELGWNFMALDMRGHGDSGGGMEQLTLSRCIADLAAALDWMPRGPAKPLLIGSSMGGAVSAWYHLLHPGRVGAIMMIAPSLDFPISFAASLPAAGLNKWREEGLLHLESDWMDVKVGYGLIEDAGNYPLERLTRDYALPTLLFQGMRDDSVDWHANLEFVKNCPCQSLQLHLIKEGGHRLTDYKTFMFKTLQAWHGNLGAGGS